MKRVLFIVLLIGSMTASHGYVAKADTFLARQQIKYPRANSGKMLYGKADSTIDTTGNVYNPTDKSTTFSGLIRGGSIRARDSMRVDSLRNSPGIGTDANGKFIKSDSTRACHDADHADTADSAGIAGLSYGLKLDFASNRIPLARDDDSVLTDEYTGGVSPNFYTAYMSYSPNNYSTSASNGDWGPMVTLYTKPSTIHNSSYFGITTLGNGEAGTRAAIELRNFNTYSYGSERALLSFRKRTSSSRCHNDLELITYSRPAYGTWLRHFTVNGETGEMIFQDTMPDVDRTARYPVRFRNGGIRTTKIIVDSTPTITVPTYLLADHNDTVANVSMANVMHSLGKVDSAVTADNTKANAPHNVTPGQIPMSNGSASFRNTGTTVDSTTGDIHVYGKLIVGDTLYTSVPGMVEGHGNQSDVDKDSLMVSLAAAPAGDKRRGGTFRAFGNESGANGGNTIMESGDSGDALIGGKEIYIHVDHPSDTSALGIPVFKNDVRIGRDDVLPNDTDRVAIYIGRDVDSSCGRIYGGKGASTTKATIELGNNTSNKITISADTVRISDRLEVLLAVSTISEIDTARIGSVSVGIGGLAISDIHRRTDTLVIKLSATDSLCFKAVAP